MSAGENQLRWGENLNEQLRFASSLIEGVTEGTDFIIAALDTDFCYTFFNTAYEKEIKRLTGKDVAIGASMIDLFADMPEQQKVAVDEWNRAMRGETTSKTIEFGDPARHRRFYRAQHSPVSDAQGRVVGVIEVASDITDRKLAQEKIRNLASFPEYNVNPVMEIDLSGRVTYANPGTRRVLRDAGLDDGDLGVFLPPDITAILKELLESSKTTCYRDVVIKDRTFAEAIAAIPQLGVGRIYATDVTERNRAEQALVANRNLLQSIIDNSPRFIYVCDLEGRYLIVNRAVSGIFGMAPNELVGRTRRDVMSKAMADRYDAHEHEVIKAGKPMEFEEYGSFQGRHVTFLTTRFPLFDIEGRAYAVAGMSIDISDRKKTEESLRRGKESSERLVEERTRELTKARTELVMARRLSDIGALGATVAHELRNPLAAIGMAAYNIRRKCGDPALDKHIANIEKKIRESDQIIDNLLFYSRIRQPQYESVSIASLIRESIGAVGGKEKKHIAIHNRLKSSGEIRIEGDPTQIREVLNNILNNARDAVKPDTGEIEVSCESRGEIVEIAVRDNGSGIDEAVLPMVFDPFFTTKAKGTGLGLSVCRQIIELHGGSIGIESEVGRGTNVIVRLPVQRKSG